jgi:hypothetical protein
MHVHLQGHTVGLNWACCRHVAKNRHIHPREYLGCTSVIVVFAGGKVLASDCCLQAVAAGDASLVYADNSNADTLQKLAGSSDENNGLGSYKDVQ